MTVLEYAIGSHANLDRRSRQPGADTGHGASHSGSPRTATSEHKHDDVETSAEGQHQPQANDPEGAGRGKIVFYSAMACLGIAAIVGVGLGVMPRADGNVGSSWRNAFALQVGPTDRNPLKLGSVSLGIKPESVYALPTRPYFKRTDDGRIVAEFNMDGGVYSVWFSSDLEGRRAQRVRFARTFEGVDPEDDLKAQISTFGSPAHAECNRLLAHQGREHCRYAWTRPDGGGVTMSLRSIFPAIGQQRTEMILSASTPPGKGAGRSQRGKTASESL